MRENGPMMNRRHLLTGLCAGLSTLAGLPVPSATAATALSLDDISAYLNGLIHAKAKIVQVNPDGSVRSGTVYIRRPGRMRLEYDGRRADLVIAGGGQIAIFMAGARRAQQYPLMASPLGQFLKSEIDLAAEATVLAMVQQEDWTEVVVQDPKRPRLGTLALRFASDPTRIVGWTVTDAYGRRTQVLVSELETGTVHAGHLFSIPAELDRRAEGR